MEAVQLIVMRHFRSLLNVLASPPPVWVLFLFLLTLVPPSIEGQAAAPKPAATKKPTAARKPAARKTTARKPVRRPAARQTRPARVPLQPDVERVKEIQQALADAGYMDTEPDGKWGDQSVAAMKRFQEDHAITPTGKINSLSLIALGLGPQRGPAPGSSSVLEPEPVSEADHAQDDNPAEAREAVPQR